MSTDMMLWLDPLNMSLSVLLFLTGLFCLLTRRNVIKQVISAMGWSLVVTMIASPIPCLLLHRPWCRRNV